MQRNFPFLHSASYNRYSQNLIYFHQPEVLYYLDNELDTYYRTHESCTDFPHTLNENCQKSV